MKKPVEMKGELLNEVAQKVPTIVSGTICGIVRHAICLTFGHVHFPWANLCTGQPILSAKCAKKP